MLFYHKFNGFQLFSKVGGAALGRAGSFAALGSLGEPCFTASQSLMKPCSCSCCAALLCSAWAGCYCLCYFRHISWFPGKGRPPALSALFLMQRRRCVGRRLRAAAHRAGSPHRRLHNHAAAQGQQDVCACSRASAGGRSIRRSHTVANRTARCGCGRHYWRHSSSRRRRSRHY